MTKRTMYAVLAAWVFSLSCALAAAAAGPPVVFLWPAGAPGAMANGGEETVRIEKGNERVVSNVHKPSITVYLPKAKEPVAAVVLVPGGGHRELWTDHEGHNIAKFLSERGIAAFVLKYRLARAPDSKYSIEGDALNDLKRAIRTVRSRAGEWNVDPKKIGVMGFSAGGQLAVLSAIHFDAGNADNAAGTDPVESASSRPDFAALVYPGPWDGLTFNAETPPMFLLCGSDDRPQVLAGITQIYLGLREAKVPAELHLYDGVPHGFGLRASTTGPVAHWPMQFVEWLQARKIAAP